MKALMAAEGIRRVQGCESPGMRVVRYCGLSDLSSSPEMSHSSAMRSIRTLRHTCIVSVPIGSLVLMGQMLWSQ